MFDVNDGNDNPSESVPRKEEEGAPTVSSPPASKRRKQHRGGEGDDGGVGVDAGEFFKIPPSNDDEIAVAENVDARKPAAISKSETAKNDGEVGSSGQSSKRKRDDKNHDGDGDDDDDDGKNDNANNNGDDDLDPLPLAPSLDEYLKSGGHSRYAPRPEWCRPPTTTTTTTAGVAAALSAAALPGSSPLPPSAAVSRGGALGGGIGIYRPNDDGGTRIYDPLGGRPAVGGGGADGRDNDLVEIHEDDDEEESGRRAGGFPLALALAARRELRRDHHRRHAWNIGAGPRPEGGGLDGRDPLGLRDAAVRGGRGGLEGIHAAGAAPGGGGGAAVDPLIAVSARRAFRERLRDAAINPAVANDMLMRRQERELSMGEMRMEGIMMADQRRRDGEGSGARDPRAAGGGGLAGGPSAAANFGMMEQDAGLRGAADGAWQRHHQAPVGGPRGLNGGQSPSSVGAGGAAVFGFECDSALHLAIKQRAKEAAMDLIRSGACINFPNAKGITPLMIASQEGTLEVVRALLEKGALPNTTTTRGSTALIQACHFGKLPVAEELLRHGAMVDQANLKNTTALMRASQEGHEGVVRLLLSHKAGVNRRNDERMTALMLSSQRGHASIVRMLVKEGAQVDAKTAQDSTSLMLACKRKHVDVARILVASGTELKLKDCKNRSVLETAARRGNDELVEILTDDAQVRLMREDSRLTRNFSMIRAWRLLQSERATIRAGGMEATIHEVAEDMDAPVLGRVCPSKRALVRAMTLPAPLIELVSSFLPLPLIWEKRLMLLTSRSHVDPDSAVFNALDLIDEVLEVGGIIEAFDAAGVNPPSSFANWLAYHSWCGKCDVILSRCAGMDVTNVFAQESDAGVDIVESHVTSSGNLRRIESSQFQRRRCNYLQVLSRAPRLLTTTLSSRPYEMPSGLFEKLRANHDIQSVVRRFSGGGIHFDTSVANEMVVMARMAVMWCESRPQY